MKHMSRKQVGGVGLGVLASAGVVIALSLGTAQSSSRPANAGHAVEPQLASSFAVLRRDRTIGDELPWEAGGGADVGAIKSQARRTRTASGHDAWVVPGETGVCVYLSLVEGKNIGPGGCTPTFWARKGAFIGHTGGGPFVPEGSTLIWGLVPDDSQVTLKMASGSVRALNARDNVLDTTIDGTPESVTVEGPQGSETVPIGPIPGH